MKLRTRLEGVAWLTGGLVSGLVILAVVSGATSTTHHHNYQTPAGDEVPVTSAPPAPSTSPSPTQQQVLKVAPTTHAVVKRALVQPLDETDPTVDPTTETPTPEETTTEPTPTDPMPGDGTQGPGASATPAPPVTHPVPTRPGQHTPSGEPNG